MQECRTLTVGGECDEALKNGDFDSIASIVKKSCSSASLGCAAIGIMDYTKLSTAKGCYYSVKVQSSVTIHTKATTDRDPSANLELSRDFNPSVTRQRAVHKDPEKLTLPGSVFTLCVLLTLIRLPHLNAMLSFFYTATQAN
ncbi:unnamed protein product [Taenia asiatica]|uniref:Cystatin domain-containing protein n=1 Tax=Taenia asiatica TaxID=60517 RepID=A0A0R3VVS1_TAEAS|nr:unnamed protein product [Taenia asiatica]